MRSPNKIFSSISSNSKIEQNYSHKFQMKFVVASFLKTILSHIKFRNPNSLQIGMRHQARAIRVIGSVEIKPTFVWFSGENIPYHYDTKMKITLNGTSESLICWFPTIKDVSVVLTCVTISNLSYD